MAKFLTLLVFVSLRLPETTTGYVGSIFTRTSYFFLLKDYQSLRFKLLWSPRIDSRESILPAYIAELEFSTILWGLGTE